MTFAIITPALIAGAFAERMKFSAMLWFMGLWPILVYCADRALGLGSRRLPSNGNSDAWFKCSTSPAARWCISTPALPA